MAARIDILLQRNEDWARSWVLADGSGEPIDLTGFVIEMQVKARLDNDTPVAVAMCTIDEPTAGRFSTVLRASEGFALTSYGNALQVANLLYDIRAIDPTGYKTALVSGVIILNRGVTRDD